MTPDEIRDTIATNPQSEAERSQLINEAIQNNMADEIPEEWTVYVTNKTPAYDDSEDLIADQYRLSVDDDTMLINAHESGAMSIAIRSQEQGRSGITPLVKFDIATGDDLIEMLVTARGVQIGTRTGISYIQEGTTGIEISFSGRTHATEYCPNCSHALGSQSLRAGQCMNCGYIIGPDGGVSHEGTWGTPDLTTMIIPDTFTSNGPYSFELYGDLLETIMDGLTAMANSAETAALSQGEIQQ